MRSFINATMNRNVFDRQDHAKVVGMDELRAQGPQSLRLCTRRFPESFAAYPTGLKSRLQPALQGAVLALEPSCSARPGSRHRCWSPRRSARSLAFAVIA